MKNSLIGTALVFFGFFGAIVFYYLDIAKVWLTIPAAVINVGAVFLFMAFISAMGKTMKRPKF